MTLQTGLYEYRRSGGIPDGVKVGDFVHDKAGTWELWRVDLVFEPESRYFSATCVTGSKYHKPGDRRRLLSKFDYVIEPNPEGFVQNFPVLSDLVVTFRGE